MKALLVLDVQKGYMKKYDADLINLFVLPMLYIKRLPVHCQA